MWHPAEIKRRASRSNHLTQLITVIPPSCAEGQQRSDSHCAFGNNPSSPRSTGVPPSPRDDETRRLDRGNARHSGFVWVRRTNAGKADLKSAATKRPHLL